MKRVTRGYEQSFAHCKLYREEIEQIVELLTKNGTRPSIQSDKYEIEANDDLFEFLGVQGRPTLRIQSESPDVQLYTREFDGQVQVSTYRDSEEALALVQRVSEVIKHGATGRLIFEHPLFGGLSVGAILSGIFLAPMSFPMFRQVGLGLSAVGMIGLLCNRLARPSARTRFFGVRRHERKTFWDRKKDDLIEKAIIAVISAVLGGAIGYYIKH